MLIGELTVSGSVGGISMSSQVRREADGHNGHKPELQPAQAGALSVRTSDSAGSLTLGAGHGVATSSKVDLYWASGRRYGVTVGTVVGTAVPITGGAGDNLPVQSTAITVQVQQVVETSFDGDQLEMIAMTCDHLAHVGFYEGESLELAIDLSAGELWSWVSGQQIANPLAGKTITHLVVTQADTSIAVFKFGALYDSTV